MRPYWRWLLIVALAMVVETIMTLASPCPIEAYSIRCSTRDRFPGGGSGSRAAATILRHADLTLVSAGGLYTQFQTDQNAGKRDVTFSADGPVTCA